MSNVQEHLLEICNPQIQALTSEMMPFADKVLSASGAGENLSECVRLCELGLSFNLPLPPPSPFGGAWRRKTQNLTSSPSVPSSYCFPFSLEEQRWQGITEKHFSRLSPRPATHQPKNEIWTQFNPGLRGMWEYVQLVSEDRNTPLASPTSSHTEIQTASTGIIIFP